jgi:hypothetical protein
MAVVDSGKRIEPTDPFVDTKVLDVVEEPILMEERDANNASPALPRHSFPLWLKIALPVVGVLVAAAVVIAIVAFTQQDWGHCLFFIAYSLRSFSKKPSLAR